MTGRQLRAHALAARAQAESPADPGAWVARNERDAEEEVARLREFLRTCRLARKKLDRIAAAEVEG